MSTRVAFPRSRWLRHSSVTVVALWGLAAGTPAGPVVAAAQPPSEPISASLARRLAEAADALRDGESVWFVINTQFPHQIAGSYRNLASAQADSMRRQGYQVFGPYRTPIDFGLRDRVLMICKHSSWPNPSAWFPPSGYCPPEIPLSKVLDMSLVIRTRDSTITLRIPPLEVDALFFSVSAFDKFVAPYYTRLYGPRYAQALRDSLEVSARRVP